MKCRACDCILTDYEATRKYVDGSFIDLCNTCFSGLDIQSIDNPELDSCVSYEDQKYESSDI